MEAENPKKRKFEHKSKNHALSVKKIKLLESRKQLPIWSQSKKIRAALRDNDVLVLSGETGSGKSTQVPQFILESPWCSGKIAVTQPRRVAAITLARRVAEEMGSPLGSASPASKVGYSVRFDDNTSPGTNIKFLTEGMLLQEMLRDSSMKQYSCIIVDEVHERSVDVDLLLGFLKGLLNDGRREGNPLKVVVMSATADVESISKFFEGDAKVAQCHVEGRQYPVKLEYLGEPAKDVFDDALQRIFKIHCKEPMPGDILVFLEGQEPINSLKKQVEEFAEDLTTDFPKMIVLPLYAALNQSDQQRIFERAPPNTRKVILSTNIAETSVTVPGVKFVIDTGRVKIKEFRNRLGLDSLLVKPISKSSADQRKGRAGREQAGQCFRLFTESGYDGLEKDMKPEILRCDLSSALLKMKARGVEDVRSFPLLTSPSDEAMVKSLRQLCRLGLLNENDGTITEIGHKAARLPLTPSLARVLLEAARPDRDCLLEVIDIVACLSEENIFVHVDTEEAREKAQEARSQLHRRQGDHLTLLATVQAYAAEGSDRKRWAYDHMVSHRAMRSVMDVRKQLTQQCKPLLSNPTVRLAADEETQDNILKCFLRVSYPNRIARLCPDKSYKTFEGNHVVAIFPSSVLFGRKVEAVMYNEFVYTNKTYARGVSAFQLKWLEEMI